MFGWLVYWLLYEQDLQDLNLSFSENPQSMQKKAKQVQSETMPLIRTS